MYKDKLQIMKEMKWLELQNFCFSRVFCEDWSQDCKQSRITVADSKPGEFVLAQRKKGHTCQMQVSHEKHRRSCGAYETTSGIIYWIYLFELFSFVFKFLPDRVGMQSRYV